MIAKHIPMKRVRKSSFGELVKYITDPQGKKERVGEIRITNCRSEDHVWAIAEVHATQARNTRATSDKTYHLLISLAPGECPPNDVLRDIEDELCNAIGFGEHERVSAVHHDTDHLHIHVAINKIHPQSLTLHDPFRDYKRLADACSVLEAKHGLIRVNHQARKTGAQNRAEDMENAAGVESLLGWIRRECLPQLLAARTWAELQSVLDAHSLRLEERGNGFVFADDSGQMVKASSVSRDLAKGKLDARLGPRAQQPHNRASQPQPTLAKRRYRPQPMPSRIDTSSLFARYTSEQQRHTSIRAEEWKRVRARHRRRIEDAKRKGRLKRATIKLLRGAGLGKKVLYATTSRTLREEIKELNESYLKDRQRIYEHFRRRSWTDWLQHQATNGDDECLAALRARERSAGMRDGITGQRGQPATAQPHHVTKRGTQFFQQSDTTIRDDGDSVHVAGRSDRKAILEALRMAQERFGSRLTLTGSDAFKGAAVEVAAEARLEIMFSDEPLEQRRAALVAQVGAILAAGDAAADKYIVERENKRRQGFDIQNHRRYTEADQGSFSYGGVRIVEGQFLALLRRDDTVLVLPIDEATHRRVIRLSVGDSLHVGPQGKVQTKGRAK